MKEEYTSINNESAHFGIDPEDEAQAEAAVVTAVARRLRPMLAVNTFGLGIALVVGGLGAGIAYLGLSNHLINQGFAFNEAKERLELALGDNRELELTAMQLAASASVGERVAALGMVSAGDVTYLDVKNQGVAMR